MTDVTMHAGLLFDEQKKNWENLKVNLDWGPYIYPFHSVELREDPLDPRTVGILDCVMHLRTEGDSYTVSRIVDEVLTSQQLHEWIGMSVKGALEHLIAWGRRGGDDRKDR